MLTLTDSFGGAVREYNVLVEVSETISLRGECRWKNLQECRIVNALNVNKVKDLWGGIRYVVVAQKK